MRMKAKAVVAVLAGVLLMTPAVLQAAVTAPVPQAELEKNVRHELIMLPYYNLFDNLAFRVNGDTVTLFGQVTRPTLKTDAARVVAMIPGVARVDNQIEVLPLSPFDNRIRFGVARAVYGQSALFRYNLGAVAPIRIIVKNGNVTLEGIVANQTDKNIAALAANGVPGVFSVTNNLRVEGQRS